MNYFIGIDGGGTNSNCVLTDINLKSLASKIGNATNFLVKGKENVCNSLFKSIQNLLESQKLSFDDIGGIILGSAGAGKPEIAEDFKNYFIQFLKKKSIQFDRFYVLSDALIALEGAFSGKSGSILIAGTGSIMFGKNENGEIFRVGGYGRYIGDEGSGYTIGRRGLKVVSKDLDGRGPKSILTELIRSNFNIKTNSELIYEVYNNDFDIATIAPFVMKAAEDNDKFCINILNEESDELISHILAMKKILNQSEIQVSFIGSLLTTDNYYSKIFREKVKALPFIKISAPIHPPEIGAAIIAKKLWTKNCEAKNDESK